MKRSEKAAGRCLVGVVFCFALAGCALFIAEGECEITSWEQTYYQALGRYSTYVDVYFKVTNTGSIDIDYYKVWFEVRCADGSTFQEWTNGLGVSPGTYVSDYTLINVAGKQATSVTTTRFEVESY